MNEAAVRLEFRARPSALAAMARALRPSPGLQSGLPAMSARWSRHRPQPREIEDFLALSGLSAGETLPLLYLHAIGFPLHMALLTHPAFPVPIWRVLQVRNRLLQRRPLALGRPIDIEVRTRAYRILDKGAEVDLHARASAGGEPAWEAVNTFYVRGRFGPARGEPPPPAPDAGAHVVARWRMPVGGGRRFGRLSGDYNGIHLFGWYARRLGFERAFFHPQRVLGQCLARLPAADPGQPRLLETWLKGPVHYGAEVALRAKDAGGGTAFALDTGGDARPAVLGRLLPVAADLQL